MTEVDIQDTLFEHLRAFNAFCFLNGYKGAPFFDPDSDTESGYKNVHFPNCKFTLPADGRWFDVMLLSNPPEPAGLSDFAQNIYTGVLYIDIYTPVDVGESEAVQKYIWISRFFERGKDIGNGVDIQRCYLSNRGTQNGSYWIQAAVEWEAVGDKEKVDE